MINNIFGRINTDGNVDVLDVDTGERVTRLEGCFNVYPVGSSLSAEYEHPQGIALSHSDACNIGIVIEDDMAYIN